MVVLVSALATQDIVNRPQRLPSAALAGVRVPVQGGLHVRVAKDLAQALEIDARRHRPRGHRVALIVDGDIGLSWLVPSSALTRCGESLGHTPGHRVPARYDHAASWGW